MSDIANLLRYLAGIIDNGDYMNEFLNLLPTTIQDPAMQLGQWLSTLIW